jgi:hypothetical protein
MSFYQIDVQPRSGSTKVQKGFLIFRDGTESGFTVTHGAGATATATPLKDQPNFTVHAIPNVPEWKIARFDFNAAPSGGQIITVQSTQSAFSLGYIGGHSFNNNCYGYFSAFSFDLPDTTHMCTGAPSVTLEGGYAKSHEWKYQGAVIGTNENITVSQEGEYTLKRNQDPTIVTVTTFVRMIRAGAISPDSQTWTDIPGATSPAYTPAPPAQTTYYRRGTTANRCTMIYSESMKIRTVPRTVPVNPHLRSRAIY